MRAVEVFRYLVLAAQREGNRQLTKALQPLGLTPAKAEAIRILADHGPLTLSGLGQMLVCEAGSNPSRLIDRLVVAGLVERVTAADDRRQVTLSLTEAGEQAAAAVQQIEEALYAGLEQATAGIAPDELVEVLNRFVAGSPAGQALALRIEADERKN
jgi:DNA-binding MarR family transcriptional regulator